MSPPGRAKGEYRRAQPEGTSVTFDLQRDAFGRLLLTDVDGVVHEGVVPVRAFPIAAPQEG